MGPSSWPAGVQASLGVASRARASQTRDNALDAQVFREVLELVSQGPTVGRDASAEAMARTLVGGGVDWEGLWGDGRRRSSRGSKAKMSMSDMVVTPDELGGDDGGGAWESDTEAMSMACDCEYLKSDDDANETAAAKCESKFGSGSSASALSCIAVGGPHDRRCKCTYSCNVQKCECWEKTFNEDENLAMSHCPAAGDYEYGGVTCEEWGTGCKCKITCDGKNGYPNKIRVTYPLACMEDELSELESDQYELEGECGKDLAGFPAAAPAIPPAITAAEWAINTYIGKTIYDHWDEIWGDESVPEAESESEEDPGDEEGVDPDEDRDSEQICPYEECYDLHDPGSGPEWPSIESATLAISGRGVRPTWRKTPVCESNKKGGTGHYNLKSEWGFDASVFCCKCCRDSVPTRICWETY